MSEALADEKFAICVRCLKLVDFEEWQANDFACDKCNEEWEYLEPIKD